MELNRLKFLLNDLKFSAGFPSDVLEHLAAVSSLVQIPAGKVLFREGSENRNLYLIQSGRIALDMNVPGRSEMRILTLGSGEMVGWSALIGSARMTASALAVEDSELICAAGDRLSEVCRSDPGFGYHLMQQMAVALSKRLVATRLQLLDLFHSPQPGHPMADHGDQL